MAKNNVVAEVTFKHFSYKNQSKKHYAINRQLHNVNDQLNIGKISLMQKMIIII